MTDGGNQRGVTRFVGVGLLLAVLGVGVTILQGYRLHGSFEDFVLGHNSQEAIRVANYMENSWRSGGTTITVRTYEQPGQTPAEFAAAHKARVDAALTQFPKDP